MLQNEYLTTAAPRRSILDRSFGFDRINTELVLYAVLFVLSIGLHLWQLDVKAMHHDESIHAWMSYKFFTGQGPFTCAGKITGADGTAVARQSATYCYDPVYHGPSLYVLTLLSYFVFGVGEAQARLPMALAGIALVPMAWTLRSLIGRKAALLAAALVTISPSILYYTRFARHDALVLLWSMFMVVGLFRFLRSGGAANLSLAAAGLALTWATHELVFILIFIGGSFFALRALWEWRPRVFLIAAGVALAATALFMAAYFGVSQEQSSALYEFTHRLLGPVLMLAAGVLLTVPMSFAWERRPVVIERFADAWRNERSAIWAALATFLVIFTLLFTTFFAYPLGFFDGWYQGIAYWLGSQHEFARGGQPWFYYLMLLPIYDLLALVFGLTGVIWLLSGGLRRRAGADAEPIASEELESGNGRARIYEADSDGAADDRRAPIQAAGAGVAQPLIIYFFGYWFIQALIGFSWAGEKMPWLLTHISLPATLLAAWVLAQLIKRVPWRGLRDDFGWSVPLLTLVLITSVAVAAYAFSGADVTVQGIQARLRGLIPLVFAGLCLFGLLTVASHFGGRVVTRLAALTIATVLLLYGIRATTLVVYRWPDTPVEPLIYTQTSPDVPILVRQIKQLAINQSRNQRSADDPTGGLTMPIVLDGGGSKNGGEGSLAWPMQWYLRDYKNVSWIDVDTNATVKPDAGVVVLYKPHLTPELESQLDEDFVKTSEGIFNWWFPEYTGAYDPNNAGSVPARGYKSLGTEGPWAVLSWPLRPSNWGALTKYMIYRTVPLELNGREMVVYMRRDVAPGGGQASQVPTETLTAEATLAQGQFNNARGIAADSSGNLYVADSSNHRIMALNAAGEQIRTIGSVGRGEGQLHEPSGVSVDDEGNLYVADTWNGRVVKFGPDGQYLSAWGDTNTPFGDPFVDPITQQTIQRYATDTQGAPDANAQNPLGFFGPRNVLVSGDRVYIADTGNSRIVVTDRNGQFIQQFGSRGAEPGQMREPIGLGVDGQGRLYVGDTWNGRIQIFQPGGDGLIDPIPVNTVNVSGWAANTYNDPFIAVAPDGRIWASQGARNTIAQFDAGQQLTSRIKAEPQLNAPKGLTLGPDNKLYLVNSGGNEVLRFQTP
jgi:uncharacterized protein (TIGR03663 family)